VAGLWDWFKNGKSLLSSARTEATFGIYSQTAKATGRTFAPDIHTYVLAQTAIKVKDLPGHSFNFNDQTLKYMEKSVEEGDGFFQLVSINQAVGTGTVRLHDTHPHSPLIIDPKYLEHPDDMRTLREGNKFSVNLVDETKAMQGIGAHLFREPFPGCESLTFKSDAYFECIGRHGTTTAFKYCGTTMRTKDDPEAVVYSRFR
jgi:choline dehydrogenase-like flavoprotein